MCLNINRSLYKENQSLKKQKSEVERELADFKEECNGTGILLDVLDAYLEHKGLHDDFKEFIKKPHTVKLNFEKNKILEKWRELK